MNKRAGLLLLAALIPGACGRDDSDTTYGVPSGIYSVDPAHAYVSFSYLHQGLSYPLLRATDTAGELAFDADEIARSAVGIAISADSIRSNIDYFDKELASRKFFHAERYPHITFRSTEYSPADEFRGTLRGDLTIREITLPVEMQVTLNNALYHPVLDVPVVGFSATGTVSRSGYGLDRFLPAVSDEVRIHVEIEFRMGSDEINASAAALARGAAGEG